MMTLDTCFLIDYQREAKRKQAGPAVQFLRQHPDETLQMSVVAWGEFLAGFTDPNHGFVQFAHDKLELLPPQRGSRRDLPVRLPGFAGDR
jgi:hypothetical protein